MRFCSFCGHGLDDNLEIFRSTLCPSCGRELKVCLHCRFYSPGAYRDCLETVSEPVNDKDRSNFCDYFRYRKSEPGKAEPKKNNAARREFGRLFGDEG